MYRYYDKYGVEHQCSTGEKDKRAALRIQNHWDAYYILNNCLPEENSDVIVESQFEIQDQVQRFLDNKSAELKASTIRRYKNHFDALLAFFNTRKAYHFQQPNTSLMSDYKFTRLKSGVSYKTVFEDLQNLVKS